MQRHRVGGETRLRKEWRECVEGFEGLGLVREKVGPAEARKHGRYGMLTHGWGCTRGNVPGSMRPSGGFRQRLQSHHPEWEEGRGTPGGGGGRGEEAISRDLTQQHLEESLGQKAS